MNDFSVVLEQAQVLTALGDLDATTQSLIHGACALRPGPCFGADSAFAPFPDEKCRRLRCAASRLASSLGVRLQNNGSTVFINCIAKGDIHSLEEVVGGNASHVDLPPLVDRQAQEACAAMGLKPSHIISISNACASGAIAVERAKELLEERRYDCAVLFGIESICAFVASGFNALAALSRHGARPFDAKRDGLSLGEAAALAVLSYRPAVKGDIVISGAGSSNDANHRTGPSRTGEGLLRAARAALNDASMEPGDIGAVKCHGTATQYNDTMEAKALRGIFGGSCPPCASFKGAIGHTSGAGSLVEILIASRCLARKTLPPTAGYALHGVDEKITLSSAPQPIAAPSILCLSAGFGGVNAAVIISEAQ